jgi:O-antigen/teichoic acid export membrane protein
MQSPSTLKHLKYSGITISALMVAGIVTLMVLSRGKGEDITGIVAPALLITIISSVVSIVAALLQKRAEKANDTKKETLL